MSVPELEIAPLISRKNTKEFNDF